MSTIDVPAQPCPVCRGALWVCELHVYQPIGPGGVSPRCDGGCAVPCECNLEAKLMAGYLSLVSKQVVQSKRAA